MLLSLLIILLVKENVDKVNKDVDIEESVPTAMGDSIGKSDVVVEVVDMCAANFKVS